MFQETHSTKQTNLEWKNSLPDWKMVFSNGKSNSKGVCTAFKHNLGIHINQTISDDNGQFLIVDCLLDDLKIFIINIYAPSTSREREYIAFLNKLKNSFEKVYDSTSAIVMGGDFNYILDYSIDRKGGSIKTWDQCKKLFDSIVQIYELMDIWRVRNPKRQKFTWRRKSPTAVQSRLDYWLVSDSIQGLIKDCNISPGIQSDHSAITISLSNCTVPKGPSLWKFNNLLLDDTNYITQMRNVIAKEVREMENIENSAQARWEFLKYKIKIFSREYSIRMAKERKKEQGDLEKEIEVLEKNLAATNSETDFNKLAECNKKLNDIIDIKTRSLIFQSKTTIYEDGEKNTKYFLNLINYRKKKSSITSLKKHSNTQELTNDQKGIQDAIQLFYEKLYSCVPRNNNPVLMGKFLNNLNKLDNMDRMELDKNITENELYTTLKTFSKGKCPGNDGLSAEFYQRFWNSIKSPLLECIQENIQKREMSNSQRQSVISLLEKEGKDKLYLKNWRPISLINVDAKLFSKTLAIRIKKVLNKLIKPEQVAYVNDRFIGDGIRLIYDIVESTMTNKENAYLTAVDFEKAFDSVNLDYMYDLLLKYGFTQKYIDYVKTLYSNIESCVINNGTTTRYFPVKRGVRQGDPLSPYLFILSIEPLAEYIRINQAISGIKLGQEELKISLYADDISLFLKDINSLKEVKKALKLFQDMSGLKYNVDKTEVLPLGKTEIPNEMLGLTWKENTIKVLGIIFNRTEIVDKETYSIALNKLKSKLNMWKMRKLSLIGKIQIIKTFGVSQILYITNMVGCSEKFLGDVKSYIYDFLWNGKDKVKRSVMIANYSEGGLKMVDISSVIRTQKIIWIKRYFENYIHPWKEYLKHLIGKLGGNFVLFGGVEIKNVNTPLFYLRCINETNRYIDGNMDNFPHTVYHQSVWHNKAIAIKKKSLFSKELSGHGIKQIKDCFNSRGVIKEWNEIHGAPSALFLQWYSCVASLKKADIRQCPDINNLCNNECIIDKILALNHKKIYNYFVNDVISERPSNELKLIQQYSFENIEYVYTLPFNVCIDSRLRAFQFRCIKDIVYLNERLLKMNLVDDDLCSLCMLAKETPVHFFVKCTYAMDLMKRIIDHFRVFRKYNVLELSVKDILYGVLIEDISDPQVKLMNHIIILYKKYLYNCRMFNSKPCFNEFISNVNYTKYMEHHIARNRNKLLIHFAKWTT